MKTMTSTGSSSITDIESATPSIAEDEAVIANAEVPVIVASARSGALNNKTYRKLSTVSKMYDINGNDELDAAELAMRTMDKSGRGHLTNDKVYGMMQEQLAMQKQLFRVKRIMFILLALVVILALSNLGTSFAAVALSKDTETSSSAQLVDKKTNENLSTQSSSNTYEFHRGTITTDGRRLKLENCDKDGGEINCALAEPDNDTTVLTMDKDMCKEVLKQCKRGNTVKLSRPWLNDDESDYEVCPYKSGHISKHNKSTLTNIDKETIIIEPIEGGHCQISGDAVLQREGNICDVGNDCAPGLGCRKVERFIEGCQKRCAMKRWAPRLVVACQSNCDHPTCQMDDVGME